MDAKNDGKMVATNFMNKLNKNNSESREKKHKTKLLTLLSFNPLQSSPPRLATSVTLMPGFSRLIDSRLSFNHNMYAESGRFGLSAILLGCLSNEFHKNLHRTEKSKN